MVPGEFDDLKNIKGSSNELTLPRLQTAPQIHQTS